MEGNKKFTVMPMAQTISLKPGAVYEGDISVVNPAEATEDLDFEVSVSPYNVIGANYTADLLTETNYSMITKWIKIEQPSGTVKPNDTTKVKFKITVPQDAPGGGQYAAIAVRRKQNDSQDEGLHVGSDFELASVLYAEVAGKINHDGQILENKIPGFSTSIPIQTSVLLNNNGNVHEEATIIIQATSIFTGDVILPKSDNEGKYTEIIMPGTERMVTRDIEGLPLVGVVKVEQTVHYLGETSTQTVNVVLCPIWFMIIIILALASLVYLIVRLVKRSRQKKAALEKK